MHDVRAALSLPPPAACPLASLVPGARRKARSSPGPMRPDRRRRAELLHARRQPRRQGRRRDRPAHQQDRQGLPERRADAGLAHAGPHLVCLLASRQEAVRDRQAALRQPDPVARPLRAGHRRRRDPQGHRHPARPARHPQGLQPQGRQLLGLHRGRRQAQDRARRLPQGARHQDRVRGRASPPTSASPGRPWTRASSGSTPT